MGRYSTIKLTSTPENPKPRYIMTKYPLITLAPSDIYVYTTQGDRYDTLALSFYNDSSLWYIIASANNIHDPSFAVEDGTTLRIPKNYQLFI